MQKVKIISGYLNQSYSGARRRDPPPNLDDDINRWLEVERPKNFTILPLSTIDGSGRAYATIIYEPGEKLKESTITVNGKQVKLMGHKRLSFLDIVGLAVHDQNVHTIEGTALPINSFRITYELVSEGGKMAGSIEPGGSIDVNDNISFSVYGIHNI